MFENYESESSELHQGHEARFEAKLEAALAENIQEENSIGKIKKQNSRSWLKIAASLAILLAVSFFGYLQMNTTEVDGSNTNKSIVGTESEKIENSEKTKRSLADISPDLKKVEEYYMAGINVQLASLKINPENKDLVDGYMQRLSELDKEYTSLNVELAKVGLTETTVTALIDNLKLRLDLLFKLKNKLKELKTQNNEDFEAIQS
ncbi:hypothetical protein [Aequorivita capsosiphonis]|uniref:hypothetical protein n=1 Tax=Aequorivita capsosiphonis TaxID=487317 RepID=UPI00146FC197|nr:hypothetical protein [Aequorivita capsosiphonis]